MAKQTFTTGQVLTAAQMTSLQETAMGGGPATPKTANYVLVAADAGTTVAMNAATATTITVNTGLFAAGDTVFIQNLGAGDCTITAGTATVATAGSLILPQNDAGILYFTSASAAIFYDYIQVGATSPLTTKGDLYTFGTSDTRLPVGTDGYTLVADSSVSPQGLKWAVDPVADVITTAGDLIYGTAADTVARLGIGTANQVLRVNSGATAPEWATPAAGGGMTQLATGTLSGSQVDLNSISGVYNDLILIVRNFRPNTDNQTLRLRLNSDTGNNYQSNTYNSAGLTDTSFSGVSNIVISGATDETTNDGISVVQFFDYANTSTWKLFTCRSLFSNANTPANMGNTKLDAFYNGTGSISAINLFPASGTFNGGTYILYGVK